MNQKWPAAAGGSALETDAAALCGQCHGFTGCDGQGASGQIKCFGRKIQFSAQEFFCPSVGTHSRNWRNDTAFKPPFFIASDDGQTPPGCPIINNPVSAGGKTSVVKVASNA